MRYLKVLLRILPRPLASKLPFCICFSLLTYVVISHCVDSQTQAGYVETQIAHWNIQLDKLTNSYLLYHMHDHSDGLPKEPAPSDNILPLCGFTIEILDT